MAFSRPLLLLLFLTMEKHSGWLENYQRKLQNLFGSKPTLAGRHQQNRHAAKPKYDVAPQRKSVGIKTKMLGDNYYYFYFV